MFSWTFFCVKLVLLPFREAVAVSSMYSDLESWRSLANGTWVIAGASDHCPSSWRRWGPQFGGCNLTGFWMLFFYESAGETRKTIWLCMTWLVQGAVMEWWNDVTWRQVINPLVKYRIWSNGYRTTFVLWWQQSPTSKSFRQEKAKSVAELHLHKDDSSPSALFFWCEGPANS